MKAVKRVLLLLVALALPLSLFFGGQVAQAAQLPSTADTVGMAAPVNAVSPASSEAALERSNPLVAENEVQSRLICHDCAFAIRAWALAMSDQSARMWRTYSVILPGQLSADNAAVLATSSSESRSTRGHLLL